jgi:hypothetical protein
MCVDRDHFVSQSGDDGSRALSRRRPEKAFEGHRRLGANCISCKHQELYDYAFYRLRSRNGTSGMKSRQRNAYVTLTSFTILLVEIMRQSWSILYPLLINTFHHSFRNFTFEDVHVKGAAMIARVASKLRVPRFVHVSHLNASRDSKSAFYRAKYQGEELVMQEFVNASIVRPAMMYGHEDKLLNNMACEPSSSS